MAKKKKTRRRKKPQGAKKPSVPERKLPQDNPLYRMVNASEICLVREEYSLEVARAIQDFLDDNIFEPPLTENYSVMVGGTGGFGSADLEVISVYGLSEMRISVIQDFLEKHEMASSWDIEIITDLD